MKIPKTFTIGQVASALSAMGAIFGLLGWFFALYFGGVQNEKDIVKVSSSYEKIQDSVNDLKVNIAEVRAEVASSKANQGALSNQMTQVQMDVRNLTSIILNKRTVSVINVPYTSVNYNP